MTPAQAFARLVMMAEKTFYARKTVLGLMERQNEIEPVVEKTRVRYTKKLHALLIGADFINQMSGSWPKEEQIWSVRPASFEKFQRMCKEEHL